MRAIECVSNKRVRHMSINRTCMNIASQIPDVLNATDSNAVIKGTQVGHPLRKLIDENAVGAISTHDLDLATTGDLEKACQTVHFSEQFREVDGKKEMTFDYRMKSGIAETTNALKLLEIVGLGEDDE